MRQTIAARSLFLACAGVAPVSRAQVVLDGDLGDLTAVAQVVRADPINEVCTLGKSGFDVSRLLVYYDLATDRLFLGLDVMDVPPGVGVSGPGVPGDSDGDNRADAPPTNGGCVTFPFSDEDGVGPDEGYLVLVDTDGNGLFTDAVDVRVRYQGNTFAILRGSSGLPIPGATGAIRLGTAGSPVSTAIPDADENRSTTDIEIRVDNWSTLDPCPLTFCVKALSGTLVDGLPWDDVMATCVDLQSCRSGNVNASAGPPANVLLINGSAGDPCSRTVFLVRGATIQVQLAASPAGPSPAIYFLLVWQGPGVNPTLLQTPRAVIGCTVNPTPLALPPASPLPILCLRGQGVPPAPCGSVPERPAPASAPFTLTRLGGVTVTTTLTLQAVIRDNGSSNSTGFSVTNAVILIVQ